MLVGLPLTALNLCLALAANADPIVQRSAGTSAPAAVILDGSAIDECQGNSGGGGGNSGGGGGNSGVAVPAAAAPVVAVPAAAAPEVAVPAAARAC